jgi:hypothetical protein
MSSVVKSSTADTRERRRASCRRAGWPLERVLFALAGTVTLLSALLAATVSPWFLLLTAFVGVNQWAYVLLGACPASVVLRRALGLRSVIYTAEEVSR